MDHAVAGQALGMFTVTNVDDMVVLTLLFGQARSKSEALNVVTGQYLGFLGILVAAVAGAAGASLLPAWVVPYLGLLPLALGLHAGLKVWSDRHGLRAEDPTASPSGVGVLTVATVTFSNGGDNIGVYVPVFANTSTANVIVLCVLFLVMVGVWCALGRFLATRRPIAGALSQWGHLVLPVALVLVGVLILVHGGGFGPKYAGPTS